MPDELCATWEAARQILGGATGNDAADVQLRRFAELAGHDDTTRAIAVRLLTDGLDDGSPWEALAYCFHALRWPELIELVDARRDAWLSDPRSQAIWFHLRGAFKADWEDRDLFPSLRR
jgi:hypothetical protein